MNNPEQSLRPSENAMARTPEVVHQVQESPASIADASSGSGMVEYWKVVVRHRTTVVLLCCLGGLVGFLATLPDTPAYRAHATLEVQSLNVNFLDFKDMNPAGNSNADPSADILTQVKLLESRSLRERAVKKLKAQGAGANHMTPIGRRLDVWTRALHLESAAPSTWESAVDMAAASLIVRASGTTRIIDVSADSTDPTVAADFPNTLVNEFIDQDLESHMTDLERTSLWLTRQLDELKIKLEKSEDQLQAYAITVGLQLGGSESKDGTRENVADAKLRQLQGEMLIAQSERIKAQAKSDLLSLAPVDSFHKCWMTPA